MSLVNLSLEAILLPQDQKQAGKKELSTVEDFGKALQLSTCHEHPEIILSFLFNLRKLELKQLLSLNQVLLNAPRLFMIADPYRRIFNKLKDYFAEHVFEIISRFPGDLTAHSIDSWFTDISTLVDSGNSKFSEAKNHVLALLTYESSPLALAKVLEDYGVDNAIPDIILGKGHGIPDQMDTGFIYVRKTYITFYNLIASEGLNGPVLICGDPGIGKSYLGLYVFCKLTTSKRNKAIRFTLSGDWIEFDGVNFRNGHGWSNSNWRDENTWLLLDGNERVEMLSKQSRVVLFASPHKNNYHNFMKKRNVVRFYLPEWSLTEMETLVKQVFKDFKDDNPFVQLVERKVTQALFPKGEGSGQTTKNPTSKEQSVSEAFDSSQVQGRVLDLVKERYELVGGRVREIFASGITTDMLKEKLYQAVKSIKFDNLSTVLGVQVESSIPSIVYKIIPNEHDPRLFKTGMCSTYCSHLIIEWMASQRDHSPSELYSVFSRLYETRAASGDLFQAIYLRELAIGASFDYRNFYPYDNGTQPLDFKQADQDKVFSLIFPRECEYSDKLSFGDKKIVTKRFDKHENILPVLHNAFSLSKERDIYILLMPFTYHQQLIDCLVLNVQQKILYFFQVTVAKQHNLNLGKLSKWKKGVEKKLDMELLRTEFVFMVPKDLFASYGIDCVVIKDDTSNSTTDSALRSQIMDNFLEKNPKIVMKVIGVDVMHIGESGPPTKKNNQA
jgi:hypothetical protein